MKAKKIAILLLSVSLTMGTVETMTALADSSAMESEVSHMPNEEPQTHDGESLTPNRNMLRFPGWRQNLIMKKPQIRLSDKHRNRWKEKRKKTY